MCTPILLSTAQAVTTFRGVPLGTGLQVYAGLGDYKKRSVNRSGALKQAVLDKTTPPEGKPGRYRPADRLLAFLKGL